MTTQTASALSWLAPLSEISTHPLTSGSYPADGSLGARGKHNVDEYDLTLTPFGPGSDSKHMTVTRLAFAGSEPDAPNAYGMANARLNVTMTLEDDSASATGWVDIGTDCDYHHDSPGCTDPTPVPNATTYFPTPASPLWHIGLDYPQFAISCVDPSLTLFELDRYVFKNLLAPSCGLNHGWAGFGYDFFHPFCKNKDQFSQHARPIARLRGKVSHPRIFDGHKMTYLRATKVDEDNLLVARTIVPSVLQTPACQANPTICDPNTKNEEFVIETLHITFG